MGINSSPSLSQVQAEFGGGNPIGLNEYYGVRFSGGDYAPSSGAISLNNFRNKSIYNYSPPPPPPPSSDPRLKDTINKIGTYNGLNVYEWVWNDIATTIYGLRGREIGFLTTELDPEYIGKDHHGYGYIKNGTMISEALKEVRVTMTK
jgi:hypothetical protein